jgi:hypothetical protein
MAPTNNPEPSGNSDLLGQEASTDLLGQEASTDLLGQEVSTDELLPAQR